MARIRTVKPEFWTSEQIMELSRDSRLLFIGMWNFCDDGGNHPASYKRLKAEVFPADDITAEDIRLLVDEWVSNDLVTVYEVNEKSYWHVNGWHHQKIDKPRHVHPKPEEGTNQKLQKPQKSYDSCENSDSIPRPVVEESSKSRRTFDLGREGNGMEGNISSSLRSEDLVHQAMDMFNEICGDVLPKAKGTTKSRDKKLPLRVKELDGLSGWRDYCVKIRGSPHLIGQNKRQWKASIDWILEPANMLKIQEGNYEPTTSELQPPAGAAPTRSRHSGFASQDWDEGCEGFTVIR